MVSTIIFARIEAFLNIKIVQNLVQLINRIGRAEVNILA